MEASEKRKLKNKYQRHTKAELIALLFEQRDYIISLKETRDSLSHKYSASKSAHENQVLLLDQENHVLQNKINILKVEKNSLKNNISELLSDIDNLKRGAEVLAKDHGRFSMKNESIEFPDTTMSSWKP